MKTIKLFIFILFISISNPLHCQCIEYKEDIHAFGIIELDTPIVVNFFKFNKAIILEKKDLKALDYESVIFKYCIFNDFLGLKMTNSKFIHQYIIPKCDDSIKIILKNCYPDTLHENKLNEVKSQNSNYFFYGNYYYLCPKKYLKVLINLDLFINLIGYEDLRYLEGNENKTGYYVKLLIPICE